MFISGKFCIVFLIFFQSSYTAKIRFPGMAGRSSRYCNEGTECMPQTKCSEFRNRKLRYCRGSRNSGRHVCCPIPMEVYETTLPYVSAVDGYDIFRDCGVTRTARMHSTFIRGGEDAEQGAWPWMVAIIKRNEMGIEEPWCSGFLIDRRHVLTAAHCFDKKSTPDMFTTKIGDVDLRQGRTFRVRRIVSHAGYKPRRFYDDIAMLTLDKNVDISNVNPICLPTNDIARRRLDGMGVSVAGWGAEIFRGDMSYTLKELNAMPVIPNKDCEAALDARLSRFRNQFPKGITKGFICAGFLEGGKDSCGGDSGAPLMLLDNGRWYAVGIVSFGYECGKTGYPAGYTRVSYHMNWIKKQQQN